MDTRKLATIKGLDIHCSSVVLDQVDAVFLFGRTKEHTDINWQWHQTLPKFLYSYPELLRPFFYWGMESGLSKVLAIGFAKMMAKLLHAAPIGLGPAIEVASRFLLEHPQVNVLGGITVVENAYDQTAYIEAIPNKHPDQFFREQMEILIRSKELLPHLPWPTGYYDLVYLHRAGKEIAGQGSAYVGSRARS